MADETYVIPEVPEYREAIRKILNDDPVNAEKILNPLIQALLENIAAVKGIADGKQDSLSGAAGQVLGFDDEGRPQAQGTENLVGPPGAPGVDGKSAYQAAVEAGYNGTETAFNNALVEVPNAATKDLSNVDNSVFLDKAFSAGVGGIPILKATAQTHGSLYSVECENITELKQGLIITIVPDLTSTINAPKLIVNNLNIGDPILTRTSNNTSLAVSHDNVNWLVKDEPVTIMYDNGKWVEMPTRPAASDIYGEVAIANGGTGADNAKEARANLGIVRTSRFVIGTSTAGWTEGDVDYLCDGIADDVEINTAIQALPSTGGEVVILDGTYNLTGSILVNKGSVTLTGNGQSTILKRAFEGTSSEKSLIYVTSNYNTIKFLSLDGAKSSYTSSNNNGILLQGSYNLVTGNTCNSNNSGIYLSGSNNNTVTGNTCNNNINYGIYLYNSSNNTVTGNTCNGNKRGFYIFGENNIIIGNTCNNNTDTGIYLWNNNSDKKSNNTVTGNTCNNNADSGIRLQGSYNLVTGNTCNSNNNGIYLSSKNNAVTGNTCNSNNSGIYLFCSNNNTVTGNTCNNNINYGIYLYNSSENNTVTGNVCICGAGAASDYTSSQYTIFISSGSTTPKNNLISSNNIMGKNYTGSGTNNTFVNNKYN